MRRSSSVGAIGVGTLRTRGVDRRISSSARHRRSSASENVSDDPLWSSSGLSPDSTSPASITSSRSSLTSEAGAAEHHIAVDDRKVHDQHDPRNGNAGVVDTEMVRLRRERRASLGSAGAQARIRRGSLSGDPFDEESSYIEDPTDIDTPASPRRRQCSCYVLCAPCTLAHVVVFQSTIPKIVYVWQSKVFHCSMGPEFQLDSFCIAFTHFRCRPPLIACTESIENGRVPCCVL